MITYTDNRNNTDINTAECKQCICFEGLDYIENPAANLFYTSQIQFINSGAINAGEVIQYDTDKIIPFVSEFGFVLNPSNSVQETPFGPIILSLLGVQNFFNLNLNDEDYQMTIVGGDTIQIDALKSGPNYNLDWNLDGIANVILLGETLAEEIQIKDSYQAVLTITVGGTSIPCPICPKIDYNNYDGLDIYTATEVCFDITNVISNRFSTSFSDVSGIIIAAVNPTKVSDVGDQVSLNLSEKYYDTLLLTDVENDLETIDYGFFLNACCDDDCETPLQDFLNGADFLNNLNEDEPTLVCDNDIYPLYYHSDGSDVVFTVDNIITTMTHTEEGIYFYALQPENVGTQNFTVTIGGKLYQFTKTQDCSCKETVYFKNCYGTYDWIIADRIINPAYTSEAVAFTPCVDCDSESNTPSSRTYRKNTNKTLTMSLNLPNTDYYRKALLRMQKSVESFVKSGVEYDQYLLTGAFSVVNTGHKIRVDFSAENSSDFTISLPNI